MEPPPTKEKKIAEKSTLATKKDFCRKVPYRYSIPRVGGMRAFFFFFPLPLNLFGKNRPLSLYSFSGGLLPARVTPQKGGSAYR